jgi:ElaB/YqjD/DUF883 family membrane-anchored ribosome-binding protein
MELYYRQDELQNLIDTLESLVDDSEYYQQYNDILNDIKYQAMGILEYVEEEIAEQEKKEFEEENREFEKSRI